MKRAERFSMWAAWQYELCAASPDGEGFHRAMGRAWATHGRRDVRGGVVFTVTQVVLAALAGRSVRQVRRYTRWGEAAGLLAPIGPTRPYDPETGWLGIATYRLLTLSEHVAWVKAKRKLPACDHRTYAAGLPTLLTDIDAMSEFALVVADAHSPPEPIPREVTPAIRAAIEDARSQLPAPPTSTFALMARAAAKRSKS